MCPGYHLEGPFLNPAAGFAGCHPPEAMGAARLDLVPGLQAAAQATDPDGHRRARDPGRAGSGRGSGGGGIVVAIGHSAADFVQVEAAAAAAPVSTHLGNGLPQILHKLANPIFAQLAEDRLQASLHRRRHPSPPARPAVDDPRQGGWPRDPRHRRRGRCRGPARPLPLRRHGDRPDGRRLGRPTGCWPARLCASTRAVRNLVAWGLATPQEALAMASDHPLALLAPALTAHGLPMPAAEVSWSEALTVASLRIGSVERHYAPPQAQSSTMSTTRGETP